MQKKEIILLSALLNAIILAFLLTTAVHESIPQPHHAAFTPPTTHVATHALGSSPTRVTATSTTSISPAIVQAPVNSSEPKVIQLDPWPQDEVDHALQPYLAQQDTFAAPSVHLPTSQHHVEPQPIQTPTTTTTALPQEEYQEVIVKKGDALDKISRQFGVSVKEIKRINQLTSDRLSIGQLLIIPKQNTSDAIATGVRASPERGERVVALAAATREVQTYVMKSGDNPWKIARAHKMKLEDLLELNGWTEESARNLQTGDSIRVYAMPMPH